MEEQEQECLPDEFQDHEEPVPVLNGRATPNATRRRARARAYVQASTRTLLRQQAVRRSLIWYTYDLWMHARTLEVRGMTPGVAGIPAAEKGVERQRPPPSSTVSRTRKPPYPRGLRLRRRYEPNGALHQLMEDTRFGEETGGHEQA